MNSKSKTDFSFFKHVGQNILFLLLLVFLFMLPTSPALSVWVRVICFLGSVLLFYFILKKMKSVSMSVKQKNNGDTLKKIGVFFIPLVLLLSSIPVSADECYSSKSLLEASTKHCWVCNVISALLRGIGNLSAAVDEPMRNMALDLLGIIFLFWIAAKVFSLFFNMMAGGVADFVSEFIRRFLLVMIAAVFLLSPLTDFYSVIINPFAQMASGFSMRMIDAANGKKDRADGGDQTVAEQAVGQQTADDYLNCCYCTHSCVGANQLDMGKAGLLDSETLDAMLCITCQSYRQVMPLVVAGQTVACTGWNKGLKGSVEYVFGWALIVIFTWVVIGVAFYVLDIFFRLAVVFILMPFFIATFPFPSTRFYSKKAFDLFIFCFLQFLGLGIVLAILCALFLTILPNSAANNGPGTMMQLIETLKSDNTQDVYGFFSAGADGLSPLRTLLICLVTAVIAHRIISSSERLITSVSGMFVPTTQTGNEVMMEVRNLAVMTSSAISKFIGEMTSKANLSGLGAGIMGKVGKVLGAPLTLGSLPGKLAAGLFMAPLGVAAKTAGVLTSPGMAQLTIGPIATGGLLTYLAGSFMTGGATTDSAPVSSAGGSDPASSPDDAGSTELGRAVETPTSQEKEPEKKKGTDGKKDDKKGATELSEKKPVPPKPGEKSPGAAPGRSEQKLAPDPKSGPQKQSKSVKPKRQPKKAMTNADYVAGDPQNGAPQKTASTAAPAATTVVQSETTLGVKSTGGTTSGKGTPSTKPTAVQAPGQSSSPGKPAAKPDAVAATANAYNKPKEVKPGQKRVVAKNEEKNVYMGTTLVGMETISLEPPPMGPNGASDGVKYSLNPVDAQNPGVLA